MLRSCSRRARFAFPFCWLAAEAGEYKQVATSYQFDVDPDEFSWVENGVEYDYGNGGWYFELNNTPDYGYKLRSLYIKFAQSYNADLTEG